MSVNPTAAIVKTTSIPKINKEPTYLNAIQVIQAQQNCAYPTTSLSITFPNAVGAGNLIVIGCIKVEPTGVNTPSSLVLSHFGTSGTALFGTSVLDYVYNDYSNLKVNWLLSAGIVSIPVKNTGTCTITISGLSGNDGTYDNYVSMYAVELINARTDANRAYNSTPIPVNYYYFGIYGDFEGESGGLYISSPSVEYSLGLYSGYNITSSALDLTAFTSQQTPGNVSCGMYDILFGSALAYRPTSQFTKIESNDSYTVDTTPVIQLYPLLPLPLTGPVEQAVSSDKTATFGYNPMSLVGAIETIGIFTVTGIFSITPLQLVGSLETSGATSIAQTGLSPLPLVGPIETSGIVESTITAQTFITNQTLTLTSLSQVNAQDNVSLITMFYIPNISISASVSAQSSITGIELYGDDFLYSFEPVNVRARDIPTINIQNLQVSSSSAISSADQPSFFFDTLATTGATSNVGVSETPLIVIDSARPVNITTTPVAISSQAPRVALTVNIASVNASWVTDGVSYWTSITDEINYTNKADLMSQITTYLQGIRNAVISYQGATMVNPDFYLFLFSVVSYMTFRFKLSITGQSQMSQLIQGDDLRTFFKAWNSPAIAYPEIFTIEMQSGNVGVLNTTSQYTSFLSLLSTAATNDRAAYNGFKTTLENNILPMNAYLLFAKPHVTNNYNNPNWEQEFILNNMHLSDVLTFFNWSIKGLNA